MRNDSEMVTGAQDARVELDAVLPLEVRRAGLGWLSYQDYPAFSWRWLRGRSAVIALGASAFGTLIALGHWTENRDLGAAVALALIFSAGALGLTSCGPLLATWVRERAYPLKRERRLIQLSLALGIVGSFLVDMVTSAAVDEEMGGSTSGVDTPLALAINLVALLVIYGLCGGWLAYRRYRFEIREMANVRRAEELRALQARNRELDTRMSILQAQLRPHFLFNALASLRAQVEAEPDSAGSAIDAMVRYLRAIVPQLSASGLESTLAQQLEIGESYLSLAAVRFPRLAYRFSVDDTLRDVPFPPLVLITLIENAVKHGVEPSTSPVQVDVRIAHEGGALRVSVEDSGAGLRLGSGGGMGLVNVREQLKIRYGSRATFTLEGGQDGGARATIVVQDGP